MSFAFFCDNLLPGGEHSSLVAGEVDEPRPVAAPAGPPLPNTPTKARRPPPRPSTPSRPRVAAPRAPLSPLQNHGEERRPVAIVGSGNGGGGEKRKREVRGEEEEREEAGKENVGEEEVGGEGVVEAEAEAVMQEEEVPAKKQRTKLNGGTRMRRCLVDL